jgi:hypothetical protein
MINTKKFRYWSSQICSRPPKKIKSLVVFEGYYFIINISGPWSEVFSSLLKLPQSSNARWLLIHYYLFYDFSNFLSYL